MRRRQFLVLAGLGATASLAGCGNTQDTDSVSTDTDSTSTDADANGDEWNPPPTTTTQNNTADFVETHQSTPTTDETATQTKLTLQTPQQGTSRQNPQYGRSERDYSTGWTFPPATGTHSVVSPGLQGTKYALRFDGFQKGYLAGALQQGERFAFSFKPTNYSGAPSLIRFQFACSGEGDGNMYRLEFEGSNTSGSDWSLEKYTNGTLADVDAAGDGVGAALGDEYRVEVDWNSSDTHITARWYNSNGTLRSTPLSITDTEYTQSGVCLMCNANAIVLWDEIQSLSS